MKFLLLLLVVVGAVLWFGITRRRPPPAGDAAAPPAPAAPSPAQPQAMLSCAHCGVHLPASDALKAPDGRVYCGEAHRQAGPRSAG